MRALVFERNLARFAASRVASTLGSGRGAAVGPLRLTEQEPPALPGPGWGRVVPALSGICGSDLSTLDGRTSRYFEDLVSFPFVPGHEVVGVLETAPLETAPLETAPLETAPLESANPGTAIPGAANPGATPPATEQSSRSGPLHAGDRVVLEPVLACAARGVVPPCRWCARGDVGNCERITFGHLAPGLQTGYCTDTGGGWSAAGLVAHYTQLHKVPDDFTDEDAVVVEPAACATHAACAAGIDDGDTVAVVGAGTLGLGVVAAITTLAATGRIASPGAVVVGARYSHQRRLSEEFGASVAVAPDQLGRSVRRRTGSLALGAPSAGGNPLTGGADVVFDCVGSATSISQSLAMVRPRGRVVLVGMPGKVHVDLASLWQREVSIAGAYAYGTEVDGRCAASRTFDLAFEVVAAHRLGRIVSATYPIERFEEALAHAGAAGRRGAVKVAFDLRHARRQGSHARDGSRSLTRDRPQGDGRRGNPTTGGAR